MQQRAGEKIEHDTEEKTEQTDTKADAGGELQKESRPGPGNEITDIFEFHRVCLHFHETLSHPCATPTSKDLCCIRIIIWSYFYVKNCPSDALTKGAGSPAPFEGAGRDESNPSKSTSPDTLLYTV